METMLGLSIMRKAILISASILAQISSSSAADLSKKDNLFAEESLRGSIWDGAYIGINAGYDVGTNANSTSTAYGPNQYVGNQWTDPGGGVVGGGPVNAVNNGASVYLVNSAATSLNNIISGTQSGFIAGGQVGYNKLMNKRTLIGIEADFMGTGINGLHNGYGLGSSANGYGSLAEYYIGGCGTCNFYGAEGRQYANSAIGTTAVNAGVNWLGTVRGRVGYLLTPELLLYGTGGLTYGNVYAKASQMALSNLSVTSLDVPSNNPGIVAPRSAVQPGGSSSVFMGSSSLNKILVGWNIGGGMEWAFEKSWSLKAEALYWNMGSVSLANTTYGKAPLPPAQAPGSYGSTPSITNGQISVNYQGIIARAGLNYHFRPEATPTLVAKY